jgi:hypothetical protein
VLKKIFRPRKVGITTDRGKSNKWGRGWVFYFIFRQIFLRVIKVRRMSHVECEVRDHLRDVDTDGRIILTRMFKKYRSRDSSVL